MDTPESEFKKHVIECTKTNTEVRMAITKLSSDFQHTTKRLEDKIDSNSRMFSEKFNDLVDEVRDLGKDVKENTKGDAVSRKGLHESIAKLSTEVEVNKANLISLRSRVVTLIGAVIAIVVAGVGAFIRSIL